MRTRHHLLRSFCCIALLLCCIASKAQNSVNATLNIIPPYTPQFGAYAEQPGKVMLLLKNNTSSAQTFYLQVRVTGDNGLSLNTIAGTKTTAPITLQPNQVSQADLNVLRDLFSSTKYIYKGITAAEVFKKNGLPEGNYEICVRAFDYNTNAPLSADAPTGCRTIQIANLEPPIPIKPMANEELNALIPQNVIFTWTIPAGAEPGTQYRLRIIEMIEPTKNINDAYKTGTTPTFYETVTMSNVLVYGPAQPPLVKGRKYAWAVTALVGPKGIAYKNNGISEVRSFTFGKAEAPPPVITQTYPADGAKMPSIEGIDANKFYFKWDYTNPGKLSLYEDIVMVEIKPGQTPQQAVLQNKKVISTNEPSKKAMFNYTGGNPDGKRFAWYVALNSNGKIFKSDIRTFTVSPGQTEPVITMLYPQDKEEFPAMGGGVSEKFSFKWDYTNPQKKSFYEDVFVYEVKPGQKPEDAVKNNQRENSTKEPSKTSMFNCSGSPDGKTYAWIVQLNGDGKTYRSEIRTFSVETNVMAGQTFKEFDFAGYLIKVNSLKDKGGFVYSGSGTTTLYKDGPAVSLMFDNLTIQPFATIAQNNPKDKDKPTSQSPGPPKYSEWTAVSGSVKCKKFYNTYFNYTLSEDIDGELKFKADQLVITAAMKTEYDEKKKIFVYKDIYGAHGAKLSGTFTWETDYQYSAENGEEKKAVYTSNVDAEFTYLKRFKGGPFYLTLQTPAGYNTMKLTIPKNTTLKLVPTLRFINDGKSPRLSFDGYYEIPTLKNGKPGITVNFSKQESMQFTQTIDYSLPVTKDNNVIASFKEVDIDISFVPKITIPQLNLKFNQNGKSMSFNFTKAFFTPSDGLYCKENKLVNGDINISGFNVVLKKSTITLVHSILYNLTVEGGFDIPFIKQKAQAVFIASEDGISEAGINVDYDKSTILYQNIAGDKCVFAPDFGVFKSDRLVMNGDLTFSNLNGGTESFNIKNQKTPDFFIKANGDVGMEGGGESGAMVPYQKAGTYNGFKFSPYQLNIKRTVGEKYKITLGGMLVLADNLASDSQDPNFNADIEFDGSKIKGGGPPPNQEVAINTGEIPGGCHDGAVDFGAKFKILKKDPVYGNGFVSEGSFGIQQPDPMQVHAKMIVARAPQGFNYWFFEAGQENVVQIPTGVLDLGIYGFTGRAYYKMNHSGTNITVDDYVPDNSKFVGIYGQTKLKTLTDNGVKFWGDVALEVLTNNSGLESIKFRGGGQFISGGVNSTGMIGAHDCELDFFWSPKEIYGNFNVTGNLAGALTVEANAGFDITGDYFELWGSGTAYLFGNTSFSCGDFGLSLTDKDINVWGDYHLIDIDKSWNFGICEPSATVKSGIWLDAYVNYSPFKFKGTGTLYGSLRVAGCKLHKTFNVSLTAKVMFPGPTCVSITKKISTPLKDFTLSAGISNGVIFWGKCF